MPVEEMSPEDLEAAIEAELGGRTPAMMMARPFPAGACDAR